MAIIVTPPIGSKGAFELAAPFDRFVDAGVEYSCMAVRKISEYIAMNERPRESIYKAYGIDDKYADDVKNDVYIASLQSRRGHWLHVPADYILSFPSGSGHRYHAQTLVFSLPPLPNALNLDTLQSDIRSLIKAQLGVESKSKAVESSLTTLVSDAKHTQVATARELAKTSNGSWEELHYLRDTNAALTAKLLALESYIKSKEIPPAP